MKGFFIPAFLLGAGYLGWQAGGSLDPDAIGMAVGIVLGVIAAIPTALLLLASGRRRDADEAARRRSVRRTGSADYRADGPLHGPTGPYGNTGYGAPQPPVIVLAGMGPQAGQNSGSYAPGSYGLAAGGGWGEARPERRFKVVGEQEAWIDEW